MKLDTNEVLQWIGAVGIIGGHSCNAIGNSLLLAGTGPSMFPYAIPSFFLGTLCFFVWTIRVANKPQMLVNVVALALGVVGLYNAWLL
jgi:hypothetical protein